ncbi:ribonuclease H-like domain-containing protein [Tanacetum coccineum]|uniref:Ribonuclease H-like domain-containing protein n=1 Tax=Tanacetum coccineum TaxID=301880 RepID=A0ABQ5IEG7_9ASTR
MLNETWPVTFRLARLSSLSSNYYIQGPCELVISRHYGYLDPYILEDALGTFDVYMTLLEEYNNESNTKVCKLNKSLYGLKQAPRQWNAKLTTALAEHGFEQSKLDYSLYTKHNGEKFISLLVYVDDIVITGNDNVGINGFKVFLSTKFMIEDLGVLKYFLGIEVVKNDLGLCMSQRKYCHELLHEYGLLAARPVDIPLLENSILWFEETSDDNIKISQRYLNFKAAPRVLRYLKGSPGCGVQFYKNPDLKIKAYADVDWAKCPKTRRPVTSMSTAFSEVVWLAIQIAANPVFHEKTKHFKLDVYFVREKVLAGIIKTVKISFDLQTADVFTKCLGMVQHLLCCKNLGMLDVFAGDMVCKDSGRKGHTIKKKKKSTSLSV